MKYIKFQNFQSSQYFHQIWCTHLVKFLKCKKLYFVRTILGVFNVFLPSPHILFFGWSVVISFSKCKYWVWNKDQVLTRYKSRANVYEFLIHGCEVFTLELIPNRVELIFNTRPMLIMIYESQFYYEWRWIKFMSSFTLVNYLVKSRFSMYQCWVII